METEMEFSCLSNFKRSLKSPKQHELLTSCRRRIWISVLEILEQVWYLAIEIENLGTFRTPGMDESIRQAASGC